jgi:predicted TIM-barrel fold metal-dependent hydrolase
MKAFVNINPNSQKAEKEFQNAIERLGFIGLKLHPRLQKFDVDSDATKRLVRLAGDLNVPVLIDAFPDGTNLMQNFNSVNYAKLALHCPKTRIIWAHMGGHYAIDFMMLAKRLPNIYMDMSYSLLYYRGSSVTQDMVYAMRSMRFERIFYGSDYPDRSLHDSLHSSIQELRNQGVNELEMKKLLESNARHFFEWSEL